MYLNLILKTNLKNEKYQTYLYLKELENMHNMKLKTNFKQLKTYHNISDFTKKKNFATENIC